MGLLADIYWILTKLSAFIIELNPNNDSMKMLRYCPLLSGSEAFNKFPNATYTERQRWSNSRPYAFLLLIELMLCIQ